MIQTSGKAMVICMVHLLFVFLKRFEGFIWAEEVCSSLASQRSELGPSLSHYVAIFRGVEDLLSVSSPLLSLTWRFVIGYRVSSG